MGNCVPQKDEVLLVNIIERPCSKTNSIPVVPCETWIPDILENSSDGFIVPDSKSEN